MSLKTPLSVVFLFVSLLCAPETPAQDFPPQLLSQLPHAAERLLADDIAQRVSILDDLVVEVAGSCTGEHRLPFDLKRSDYSFIAGKIFEKNLSELDEKRSSQALHKLSHLVGKFELKEFARPISKYLTDPNWRTKAAALGMLDTLQAKDLDAEVAELLSTDNEYVRGQALDVLVRFGSIKALPALIPLLYAKDVNQRVYGLRRIVLVNGRPAAPHVAKLIRDEDANVRHLALDTLVKLNAKEQAEHIWFLTTGQTSQTEAYSIVALVYFGDAKAINLATEKIANGVDPDNNITAKTNLSGEIISKITELNAKAIVPHLIALLENPPPTAVHPLFGRSDIVYALGKLDAKESSSVLRAYLHQFPMGRTPAIQVLGDFRDPDAVDQLFEIFLTYLPKPVGEVTNDNYLSANAAVALAKIGDRRTWKALLDAAESPRFPYRSFVIEELNRHINRKLWDRVAAAKVTGKDFGNIKVNAELFSGEVKIPIALEYDPRQHYFRFAEPGAYPQLRTIAEQPLQTGLKDIVAAIDSGTLPNRFTYIMDNDGIRILPVEDAVKWWRTNILVSPPKN